jgi:hypothetical protein
MSLKSRCLALLLILTSAWVHDLQAKVGVVEQPVQTNAFQKVFALLSAHERIELLERIELSHVATVDVHRSILDLDAIVPFSASCNDTVPCLFSSADICYRLMSLQC